MAKKPYHANELQEAIRASVDPLKLLEMMRAIANGEMLAYYIDGKTGALTPCPVKDLPEGAQVLEHSKPTVGERMKAIEFIADRAGWTAPKSLDVNVTAAIKPKADYSKLSDEDLNKLIELTDLAALPETTDDEE